MSTVVGYGLPMDTITNWNGTPLAEGMAVQKLHIDDGAPGWATTGRVIGFTRTGKVKVHWDGVSYGPERWQFPRPHVVRPQNLRDI